MKVFITGINGFLGSNLASRLRAAGHVVLGSARQAGHDKSITPYVLGATPPATLFQDCSAVIHCAWDLKGDAKTDNVQATRALVEAARRQGVGRQIFISSLSARADAPTRYGAEKYAAEAAFDSATSDSILRPGLIVGVGGLFRQTYDFIRDHRYIPLIDGGHFPMPLVGIQELISCVENILEAPQCPSKPLMLFHRHIPSQRECMSDIIKLKGWKRNFIWLPSIVLKPGLAILELFPLRLPITRGNVVAALTNRFTPDDSQLNSLLGHPADYEALIQSLSTFDEIS